MDAGAVVQQGRAAKPRLLPCPRPTTPRHLSCSLVITPAACSEASSFRPEGATATHVGSHVRAPLSRNCTGATPAGRAAGGRGLIVLEAMLALVIATVADVNSSAPEAV